MRLRDQLTLLPPVRPLGERFDPEFFRRVPERPGVYLMCGAGEGVLYVGKAKNLRQRLGQYRSARSESLSRKLCRLLLRVERIHWDECDDEAAALLRERELLIALRPSFNTMGVYPSPPQAIGWDIADGEVIFGISKGAEGLPGTSGLATRLRPIYSAALRLLWGACHPERILSSMPSPLCQARPPEQWRAPLTASLAGEFAPLPCLLSDFFSGRSSAVVDWLTARRAVESKFEKDWQEQDAELLREFFARRTARAVPLA